MGAPWWLLWEGQLGTQSELSLPVPAQAWLLFILFYLYFW
jgi:hypothetical protein